MEEQHKDDIFVTALIQILTLSCTISSGAKRTIAVAIVLSIGDIVALLHHKSKIGNIAGYIGQRKFSIKSI